MIKSIIYFILIHIQIIVFYLILGMVLPILFNIEIPIVLLFTWIIAPISTVILTFAFTKYLKTNRAKQYIVISFTLNLIYIIIYTYFESKKPYIDGDFMDFRGLLFSLYGIGQIVGIVFSFFLRNKKIHIK